MGLVFHYRASIHSDTAINELITEVKDIACVLKWKYRVIRDNDIRGIVVSPKKCEPLHLTFSPNLKLCTCLAVEYFKPDDPYYYWAFTKTQFAGPDTHIALLKLLKYLSDKYFSEIEVLDEGEYWGKWDEKLLAMHFSRFNFLLDQVEAALSQIKSKPDDTAESLAQRIDDLLKRKFGRREFEDLG